MCLEKGTELPTLWRGLGWCPDPKITGCGSEGRLSSTRAASKHTHPHRTEAMALWPLRSPPSGRDTPSLSFRPELTEVLLLGRSPSCRRTCLPFSIAEGLATRRTHGEKQTVPPKREDEEVRYLPQAWEKSCRRCSGVCPAFFLSSSVSLWLCRMLAQTCHPQQP